ncbi:MAG: molybdopterin converting factor subunit 1 [Pseudomonadales bacterium]|jgi:molybdopterin synthase sulfur carrier subunit
MSTVKILYFARLRDELDCAEEIFDLPHDSCSVSELKQALADRGDAWRKVFNDGQLLAAVNQAMANADTRISANDEVGFFPPVTGG